MVGIAGEDDLDAPPDVAGDQPKTGRAADVSLTPNPGLETTPVPPVQRKLGVEGAATNGAELIREIETIPQDDLQSRAIAILKAKNRLSAEDAKHVEDAFVARMARQDALPRAPADELPFAPTDPSLPETPSASTDADKPKRPRGRPRKVKAEPDQSAEPRVTSKPAIDDSPLASTVLQADAAPTKIEKSELTISEPRRHRDKAHLKFVTSQPCLVCGRSPADAHHLRFTQPRAMGRKVSDEFTVPLCRTHHRHNHDSGDEVTWWERRAIDPIAQSRMLWISTRRIG